jgi:hypothetical protein
LSERRRVRLGGVGFGFVVEGWCGAVVSSFAVVEEVVVVAGDDDGEEEGDVVVPMRKRNVCGTMA